MTSNVSPVDDLHDAIGGEGRTSQWTHRREAIVQAAAEVFNDVGFERGTTKQIAERVGLSQSSVYHYVGNKNDLMIEITRRIERVLLPVVTDFDEGMPAREQLARLIVRFTEQVLANQVVFAACWNELDSVPEPELSSFLAQRDRFVAAMQALVVRGQAEGALPAGDPSATTQAILGLVSSVYLWYDRDGPLSPTEVGHQLASLIGVSPQSGPSPD